MWDNYVQAVIIFGCFFLPCRLGQMWPLRYNKNSRVLVKALRLDYRTFQQPSILMHNVQRLEQYERKIPQTTKAYRSIITLMMYEALRAQSSNGSEAINRFGKNSGIQCKMEMGLFPEQRLRTFKVSFLLFTKGLYAALFVHWSYSRVNVMHLLISCSDPLLKDWLGPTHKAGRPFALLLVPFRQSTSVRAALFRGRSKWNQKGWFS